MKKFKGFNETQIKSIATKLGFQGPVEKFSEFLASSPQAASAFNAMSKKALSIIEGQSFAQGGEVKNLVPFATQSKETKDRVTSTLNSSTANVPSGVTPKTSLITENSNQLIKEGTGQVTPQVANQPTAVLPNQVNKPATSTYDASKVTPSVTSTLENNTAAQGTVNQNSQVQAQTQDPNTLAQLNLQAPQLTDAEKKEGTVQEQMKGLNEQFKEGQPPPPWAAGVLRNVSAMMAARGIDASSVTAQAATQAAMEAATAIAQADAQLLGSYNLANLDVRKQKMLSDAAAMSAMEMQNLNNRQQAAVSNAQAFLAMDFKNLDNKQQTNLFNFQARVNAMLSDQAQVNAAKQFNATSENDLNKFFGQLSTAVDIQRAEIANDTNKFNAEMRNQRDQFNATNALQISAANAKWRQEITTANTAAQNLSNQLTAASISRMNETAFNAMIQLERDEMNYVNEALTRGFTGVENELERKARILIASLDRDAAKKLNDAGYKYQAGNAIGGALVDIGGSILGKVFGF
jgi:hypothetical protein